MEGYELFKPTSRGRQPAAPRITLGKNGALTLNTLTLEAFGVENPECVQLLYNAETQTVALRVVSPDEPYSYRLRKSGSSQSRSVSARSFVEHHSIDYSERREFAPTQVETGVITFSLIDDDNQVESPKPRKR